MLCSVGGHNKVLSPCPYQKIDGKDKRINRGPLSVVPHRERWAQAVLHGWSKATLFYKMFCFKLKL